MLLHHRISPRTSKSGSVRIPSVRKGSSRSVKHGYPLFLPTATTFLLGRSVLDFEIFLRRFKNVQTNENSNFRLSNADSLVYPLLRKLWRSARANPHEQPLSRRLQFSAAAFSRAIGCRSCHRHSPGDSDMDSVLHGAGRIGGSRPSLRKVLKNGRARAAFQTSLWHR